MEQKIINENVYIPFSVQKNLLRLFNEIFSFIKRKSPERALSEPEKKLSSSSIF